MRTMALIGVPSSAGAHYPGVENAPEALREARFRTASMCDYGDLPRERFRPDPSNRRARNREAVVRVATAVRDRVRRAYDAGHVPVVLGGDCSITVGVVAAFIDQHPDGALVYFDGHADLNTPADSASGILDSMALAHILGEPSVVPELAEIGRVPLLQPADVSVFASNEREMNRAEAEALARKAVAVFPVDVVRRNAARSARSAIERFENAGRPFLVHFDVDVIDTADFPLPNIPQFSDGLAFSDAMTAMRVFANSRSFAGVVITELNPDHDDRDCSQVDRFAAAMARIFRDRSEEER